MLYYNKEPSFEYHIFARNASCYHSTNMSRCSIVRNANENNDVKKLSEPIRES